MSVEQTSYGDVPVSPTPLGESAELVLAGIERKHLDPKRYEFADSEQAPQETEPSAHTPLRRYNPPSQLGTDSEGNLKVKCRFCGDSVVRAVDEKYNKTIYLDWVPGKTGKFLVRNSRASFWGPTGASWRKHICQIQTMQEQAG